MERFNVLVQQLTGGSGAPELVGALSSGERAYVALASKRYDLIGDPIEAWSNLEHQHQLAICRWRGWPERWAQCAR